MSECLMTGFHDENGNVALGTKLFLAQVSAGV
jgi:hypothetical protein